MTEYEYQARKAYDAWIAKHGGREWSKTDQWVRESWINDQIRKGLTG
jgi:hypothetical protein